MQRDQASRIDSQAASRPGKGEGKRSSTRSLTQTIVTFVMCMMAASAIAKDVKPARSATASCNCTSPWREYTRTATPQVQQLFKAAQHADEETFARLIGDIPDIHEYAINGQPLLAALLNPVESLHERPDRKVRWEQSPEAQQRLRAAHAATLPAKTRMLILALKHGASVKDITYSSRLPPLHLATVFGTAEMVRLLLQNGADANQIDANDSRTPIEFALDHEYFMRMTYLPHLVGPEERTGMLLALVAAGAKRPYSHIDQDADRKNERPAADYLLWPALAELTRGVEIMEAMATLGTRPASDEPRSGPSPLAHAARAGNVGGVKWLKANLPRIVSDGNRYGLGEKKHDLWLEAAAWALYPSEDYAVTGQQIDEILTLLVTPDMRWDEAIEKDEADHRNLNLARPDRNSPNVGHTLLHHLAFTKRHDWIQKVVRMGAPVNLAASEKLPGTPLAEAVLAGDIKMVQALLALGADPLAGLTMEDSALYQAIAPNLRYREEYVAATKQARPKILETLLAGLTSQQKLALAKAKPSPLEHAFPRFEDPDPHIARILLAALPQSRMNSDAFATALRHKDASLATELLDSGVSIEQVRSADKGYSAMPVLLAALRWNRRDLLPRLVKAGAEPNLAYEGESAVAWAIGRGDEELLDELLALGGRIETRHSDSDKQLATSLDYAVSSGFAAMLRRIGAMWKMELSQACLPDSEMLLATVKFSGDAYWKLLIDHGLGSQTAASANCAGFTSMPERLLMAAIESPDDLYVGWRQKRMAERLAQLWHPAVAAGKLPPDKIAMLREHASKAQRDDLLQVLQYVGVSIPVAQPNINAVAVNAKPSAQDRRMIKKLAGHYYLNSVREVGSEILLKTNGKFEFMMAYGAVDQMAQGSWSVAGGQVIFRTPSAAPETLRTPYALVQAQPSVPSVDANELSVKVLYQDKPVPNVMIRAIGCDAPEMESGITSDVDWVGSFPGKICQIVLHHPRVNDGLAFNYEVKDKSTADAARRFVFEVSPPSQQETPFNTQMRIKGKTLIWQGMGRPMEFVRYGH